MSSSAWSVAPRSVKALYVCSFLMNMGFYALIPYLTLYLTGSFAWSMVLTGVLLGIRQFSQQGFTFVGGILADRYGYKEILVIGVLIRAAGFLFFAYCTEVWHFFIAAILSGVGGALFEPSLQAAYARLCPEEHRKVLFSFKNVITNAGVILSTLIGSLLSSVDFFYLSIISGMLFVAVAGLAQFLLPKMKMEVHAFGWAQDIRMITNDKPFIIYTLILIGYYYLYMQLFLTMPKQAEEVSGGSSGVAYIFMAVSFTVILLQMRVTRLLERFSNRFTLIGIGSLCMGIGLFFLGFSYTIFELILAAVIFSLGTVISGPLLMDVVPLFAPKNKLASYYGFNGYSLAIGGALSTTLGGWFYDLGELWNLHALPWAICLLISIVVAWRLHALEQQNSLKLRLKKQEW